MSVNVASKAFHALLLVGLRDKQRLTLQWKSIWW
jgi:hypothetical protein